ncbi:hypothetical protein COLO4_33061 [Corchorus olitorius]|uniref:J domain-containing protein n=1 Tax=Corchorus olitorius TaxID=93759 RepID=A0A1R3GWL2_9ROSI|nr:hypothetical protein COLO4_33061 [Corchorus olitorius]
MRREWDGLLTLLGNITLSREFKDKLVWKHSTSGRLKKIFGSRSKIFGRAPKKSDNSRVEIVGALKNFKELAQAYEVLSAPEKRQLYYEEYGEDAIKEGMGGGAGAHDPFDIFSSFFFSFFFSKCLNSNIFHWKEQ